MTTTSEAKTHYPAPTYTIISDKGIYEDLTEVQVYEKIRKAEVSGDDIIGWIRGSRQMAGGYKPLKDTQFWPMVKRPVKWHPATVSMYAMIALSFAAVILIGRLVWASTTCQ